MKWRTIGLFLALVAEPAHGMSEQDRLDEYARRHYAWPPAWNPPTPGWKALMERREKQVMALDNSQSRWDAWSVLVGSSTLVRNFTERGYAVARAPEVRQYRHSGSIGPAIQVPFAS